jgi:hypothetical protein
MNTDIHKVQQVYIARVTQNRTQMLVDVNLAERSMNTDIHQVQQVCLARVTQNRTQMLVVKQP